MKRRASSWIVTASLVSLACTTETPPPKPAAAAAGASAGKPAGDKTADDKGAKADEKAAKPNPMQNRREAAQQPPPDDLAAAPADAEKADSGVACKVLTPGTGDKIALNDSVKMFYTGWAEDGTTVETTAARKSPRTIKVNRPPIKGWADALQMMTEGEKRRCWLPADQISEGRRGGPEGPRVYELEVAEVMRAPKVPADVAAPPADAQKTESGLAYKVVTEGTEDKTKHPHAWDRVTVDYSGWTTDGKMFDSSVVRGKPATFGLGQVIKGWTEGVQLMAKGDTYRFWIPEALAYKGQPGKPAGMLVFDISLNDWQEMPEPPPPPEVPEDVAAPPADAKTTASGLAYKVLEEGDGKTHPAESDRVECHYSGWTTDGEMFDSSVTRGRPSTFGLGQVIKGWTEGLQLMTVGAKYRFWIPVELAYQNRPGKPAGMLVFDVELLSIK